MKKIHVKLWTTRWVPINISRLMLLTFWLSKRISRSCFFSVLVLHKTNNKGLRTRLKACTRNEPLSFVVEYECQIHHWHGLYAVEYIWMSINVRNTHCKENFTIYIHSFFLPVWYISLLVIGSIYSNFVTFINHK